MDKEKFRNMILITDEKIITKIMDPNEVMAKLLYAFLSVWNDEKCSIDILDVAEHIVDLLSGISSESSLFDMLERIFSGDDGDDEDGET